MKREEFKQYLADMIDEFYESLKEVEECADEKLSDLVDISENYIMNTAFVHDIENANNEYYLIRSVRDALQECLRTYAVKVKYDNKQ